MLSSLIAFSMASVGVNTNGSQFYISLSPSPYLNGRCVVFGRVIAGDEVLQRMEKVSTHLTSRVEPLIL